MRGSLEGEGGYLSLIAEASVARRLRQQTGRGIPEAIGEIPGEYGNNAADHLLDHAVIVQHGAHQHDVPQQLQGRHADE